MSVSVAETATPSARRAGSQAFGPVARPAIHRTFTAHDLVAVGGLRLDDAKSILSDFAARGICERIAGGRYCFTPEGREIAFDLVGALEGGPR